MHAGLFSVVLYKEMLCNEYKIHFIFRLICCHKGSSFLLDNDGFYFGFMYFPALVRYLVLCVLPCIQKTSLKYMLVPVGKGYYFCVYQIIALTYNLYH